MATLGLMLHEVEGHCNRTDFTVDRTKVPALVNALFGVVEDLRIESHIFNVWPGARDALAAIVEYVFGGGRRSKSAEAIPASAALCNWALCYGRSRLLGQDVKFAHWERELLPLVGKKGLGELKRVLGEVTQLQGGRGGTSEALELAEKLVAVAAAAASSKREQDAESGTGSPKNKTGGDDVQPEKGEATSNVESDGEAEPESNESACDGEQSTTGQPKSNAESGTEGSSEAGESAAPTGSGAVSTSAVFAPDADVAGVQLDLLDAVLLTKPERIEGLFTMSEDAKAILRQSDVKVDFDHPGVTALVGEALRKLDETLTTQTKCRVRYRDTGERVDVSKATEMRLGKLNVFPHRTRGEAIDTACTVLLDISGSMMQTFGVVNNTVMSRAGIAGAVVNKVVSMLDDVDVPVSVMQFGSLVTTVKGFDERFNPAIRSDFNSDTRLDLGLMHVLPSLLARREARKLLFVVTDGTTFNEGAAAEMLTSPIFGDVDVIYVELCGQTKLGDLLQRRELKNIQVALAHDPQSFVGAVKSALERSFGVND